MAELVDAHVSGACVERRAGSTPVLGTNKHHEASNIINVIRLIHFYSQIRLPELGNLPSLNKSLHIALYSLEYSIITRCFTQLCCLEGTTPEDVRFIYVYRLAIDARPKWGDGVAA